MKKALFAGSFDPPTLGHLDLIARASKLCDQLHIGIGTNISKESLFTIDEKISMLKELCAHIPHVQIGVIDSLAITYAKKHGIQCLIRSMRSALDFEQELPMALANRHLSGIETVFLTPDPLLGHISSTLIKEIGTLGGPLEAFIPKKILSLVANRLSA